MLMLCRRIVELVKPLSPRPSGTVDKYTERRCRRVETDGFPARTRTITENSKDNVQLQGSTRRAAETGERRHRPAGESAQRRRREKSRTRSQRCPRFSTHF